MSLATNPAGLPSAVSHHWLDDERLPNIGVSDTQIGSGVHPSGSIRLASNSPFDVCKPNKPSSSGNVGFSITSVDAHR